MKFTNMSYHLWCSLHRLHLAIFIMLWSGVLNLPPDSELGGPEGAPDRRRVALLRVSVSVLLFPVQDLLPKRRRGRGWGRRPTKWNRARYDEWQPFLPSLAQSYPRLFGCDVYRVASTKNLHFRRRNNSQLSQLSLSTSFCSPSVIMWCSQPLTIVMWPVICNTCDVLMSKSIELWLPFKSPLKCVLKV